MEPRYNILRLTDHLEIDLPSGRTVKIDFEDEYLLKVFPVWVTRRDHVCCERLVPTEYGQAREKIFLHRLIVQPAGSLQVDHRNRDGHDNRRLNLRVCTRRQNTANAGPKALPKSGYRGVCFIAAQKNRPWRASIGGGQCRNGKYLGSYLTAIEAALAYDAAAKERHGEFAVLNFPVG